MVDARVKEWKADSEEANVGVGFPYELSCVWVDTLALSILKVRIMCKYQSVGLGMLTPVFKENMKILLLIGHINFTPSLIFYFFKMGYVTAIELCWHRDDPHLREVLYNLKAVKIIGP